MLTSWLSLCCLAATLDQPPQLAPPPPPIGLAVEVNVLWPFFPGGVTDIKLLIPVVRRSDSRWRGELELGLHSDFATRFVRADDHYGKVSILAVKVGYRQFFGSGVHIDASVDSGWRRELHNVYDGTTLDAFSARLWLLAGYQYDIGRGFYANARAGAGIHLIRTDRFAEHERKLVPGADINAGVRF